LRIQRAEQQCTDLISALLLLSRNERGHGNTDVAKVAEQLLDAHRVQMGAKPLQLRLEGEAGQVVVDAPEAAVNVALGNLVGNAVKYTQQGEVVVRLREDAVEVIDSGPGLSAEDAARLFERGYRGTHAEHSQGGGIGLSIVRRLCALYDWSVRVVPGERQGVVATLSFRPNGDSGPQA
jgi:signal transduction histidine kinase